MTNKKTFLALVSLSILMTSCNASNLNKINSDGNNEVIVFANGERSISEKPTIDTETKNGEVIEIVPKEWMDFYKDNSSYMNVEKYYTPNEENTKPVDPTITWTLNDGYSYCLFFISDNYNMENYISYVVPGNSVTLKDLYAGEHYFFQVQAYYSDKTIISRVFDFKTVDWFRLIDLEGVKNARDIGNKLTYDGTKKLKQGLVYRSGTLDNITNEGKARALNLFNIKVDLDLREPRYSASPLGNTVRYINNGTGQDGSPYYVNVDRGIDALSYQPGMAENLKMFANPTNLPLIFHCSLGRDRTGTLAIVLELLLCIELNAIKEDYAVYMFSNTGNQPGQELTPTFRDAMESIFTYLSNYAGKDGVNSGSIYERTVKYCLDIGLTYNDIESIRNNLLEDVK